MTRDNRSAPPRSSQHLSDLARDYPGIWRQVDHFRAGRGRDLPLWPDWCYLPLAAAYAIASGGRSDAPHLLLPGRGLENVGRIGALAAWRPTQGIYRYDPAVLDALWETPISGDLPADLLYRLPEWCVYIETPGRALEDLPLHGYYAHLEWDTHDGRTELRLLLDSGAGLLPLPIHLHRGTLAESLRAAEQEAHRAADAHGHPQLIWPGLHRSLAPIAAPLVSVLLYLCSINAEMRDASGSARSPERPRPKNTKKGPRIFPPSRVTTWEVAWRMGAALRRAEAERTSKEESSPAEHPHGRPRPHIRRAHWHAYWTGPRSGERRLVLRWLHPMLIAATDAEIIPTVHRVE